MVKVIGNHDIQAEKADSKLIEELNLSITEMKNENTITVSFSSPENIYNYQKDLLSVLQAALNNDVRNGAGYYVIELIGTLAELQFGIANKQSK